MQTPVISDQSVNAILNKLDALAQKLGVTAQFVYSIYVKQAYVEAIRDTVVSALFLSLGLSFGYLGYRLFKYGVEEDYDGWPFSTGSFSVLIAIVSFIFCVAYAYSAFGEFSNPQFWALTTLFQNVK